MSVAFLNGCRQKDTTVQQTPPPQTTQTLTVPTATTQPSCLEAEDLDGDLDYDLVSVYDGCSLADAKSLAQNGDDVYLPKDDGVFRFLLTGEPTGTRINGGLVVNAGETITVDAVIGYAVDLATSSGGTTLEDASIYVDGGTLTLNGNSYLRVVGDGVGLGVASVAGEIEITETEFDNLGESIVAENTNVTLFDVDVILPRDFAVHISETNSPKATIVNITDLAIRDAVVGFDLENKDILTGAALVVAGAREATVTDSYVLDQETPDSVVDIRADYVSLLGVVVAGAKTEGFGLSVESGCHYILPTQQYSVVANSGVANSLVGPSGALSFTTVQTEGEDCEGDSEIIIQNTVTAFNVPSQGYMEQVVQLNGSNGKVEFGNNIVAENEGVVGPTISRSVDGNGTATNREVVIYNAIYANGDGDEQFTNPDGTNLVGTNPQLSDPFYDNVADVFNPWALYPLNPALYYTGADGVNYQDSDSSEILGSIGPQGGPNSDNFNAVLEQICEDLLEQTCEEYEPKPDLP